MVYDRAESLLEVNAPAAEENHRPSALEMEVTQLFDQWRDPLLRYVLASGLPLQEGEEVIQEVFLSLFHHLRQGKSRANLRGWIFRVGHHLSLKRRYSAGRRYVDHVEHGALEQVEDPAPNPEQAFAREQRRQRLAAVLAALPEQDRYCLSLRAEGLRYREIAEVLRMSLGAVALSLSRSLERLKRADR